MRHYGNHKNKKQLCIRLINCNQRCFELKKQEKMAKVLFIQDLLFEFLGPMYLASYLQKRGHTAEVIILNEEKESNLIKKIKEVNPDLIAFSIMSTGNSWAFITAKRIKEKFNIPIIFGGAHPTFFPEMINYPYVDMICVGEGEEAIADLVEKISKKEPLTDISNISIKKDGQIQKSTVRSLVNNLDDLPFPSRELYYSRYKFLKNLPTKRFLASRGCPYNCTFCFNHKLKEMYKGKGSYLRWRSPDNIIKEIKEVKEKYHLKTVRFVDDTFTLNKPWLYELLDKYKQNINLPFTCLCRANEINKELVIRLKRAGCLSVTFGIESGNEEIREKILHKNLKNEHILNAARLFRKYKIKFGTYNMIALPGELLSNAFETLELNAKIRTNNPMCSIFQPFPKTELAQYAIEQGYLTKNFDFESVGSLFGTTSLKMENRKEFVNLHKLFMVGVWFPWTIPLIRQLIKLPNNFVFNIIYKLSYGFKSFRSFNINILTGLRLGYKLKSRFKEQTISSQE